jgi:hypothetical protein
VVHQKLAHVRTDKEAGTQVDHDQKDGCATWHVHAHRRAVHVRSGNQLAGTHLSQHATELVANTKHILTSIFYKQWQLGQLRQLPAM